MLEKLNDIDWYALNHMYGSAEDLPGLIRNLISQDEWVRDEALEELSEKLYHQNSVGDASAVAIPFLIGLLGSEGNQDKLGILELLNVFVDEFRDAQAATSTNGLLFARGTRWQAVFVALHDGIPTYTALLTDGNPKIAVHASLTLSIFSADRARLLPDLWRVVAHERDPRTVSAALLCIGSLIADAGENPAPFVQVAYSDLRPAVCYVAAIEAVLVGKRCEDPDVERLVATPSNEFGSVVAHLSWSPWGLWFNLHIDAAWALCTSGSTGSSVPATVVWGRAERAYLDLVMLAINMRWKLDPRSSGSAPLATDEMLGPEGRILILQIVTALPWHTQGPELLPCANHLLACLFARHKRSRGSDAYLLTASHRAVLMAIAECGLWASDWWAPEIAKLVRAYNLPDTQQGIRNLVSSAPGAA